MRVCISCALTHVPRQHFTEYTDFIHQLASSLAQAGINEVAYALKDSDPQLAEKPFHERARLCYYWDREMVQASDIVIAEASFPSTGLGIELQIAESRDIPVILCFRDYGSNKVAPVEYENPDHQRHQLQIGEGYISLMALGLPSIYRLIKYETREGGIAEILSAVGLLQRASS